MHLRLKQRLLLWHQRSTGLKVHTLVCIWSGPCASCTFNGPLCRGNTPCNNPAQLLRLLGLLLHLQLSTTTTTANIPTIHVVRWLC